MNDISNKTNPRDRILETAAELFFYQGYRATGINEVITKAEVAKATFYSHFPTKEDLCLAYLRQRNTSEFENITSFVNDRNTPLERFMAVIESMEPWLEGNALRGCCFLNMVAEIPDPGNRLRQLGNQHYEMMHDLIKDLAQDLIDHDKTRYSDLDADELAEDYMIILVGAIAMSEVYNDTWPARQAVNTVKRLIA